MFVDLISRHARERERVASWIEGLSVDAVEPAAPEIVVGLYTTYSTSYQHDTADGGSSNGEARLSSEFNVRAGRRCLTRPEVEMPDTSKYPAEHCHAVTDSHTWVASSLVCGTRRL
jgi:hypothetical protein